MHYRPEIDALRAVAVVPVVLFHAGVEIFRGGFLGVDVFFVISGYLITTILIEDILNQRYSLLGFYERRARRILPLLVLIVVLTAAASFFIMLPDHFEKVVSSASASLLFVSNVFF